MAQIERDAAIENLTPLIYRLNNEGVRAIADENYVPNFRSETHRELIDKLTGWDAPITLDLLSSINPSFRTFQTKSDDVLYLHPDRMKSLEENLEIADKLIFIITAAPGSGKDTITTMLENFPIYQYIIRPLTGTTRPEKTEDPKDKVTIRCYSEEEFNRMKQNGELIEHVTQWPHQYGTRRIDMEAALMQPNKKIILWRGEPIGALKIKYWAKTRNIPTAWFFLLPRSGSFKNLFEAIGKRNNAKDWREAKGVWEILCAAPFADGILINPDSPEGPVKPTRAIEQYLRSHLPR